MLLQPSIPSPVQQHLPFSSTSIYSQTNLGFYSPVLYRNLNISISCTFSDVHNNGDGDDERKSDWKWKDLYRKIAFSSVLSRWEEELMQLSKLELLRCVKELRKYHRFNLALQVYEWMNNQGDKFKMTSSDNAIQLDLISKVHGVSSAEAYFLKLPWYSKNKRTYGALLNAYVQARMREKAESLFEKMIDRGYTTHYLPFNVMMTLYMNLKEYEKIFPLITEMLEKNVQLDKYSYHLWLTTCGALGSKEKMEQVVEWMELDGTIKPNWVTYTTMASMYIKLGRTEEAKDCLKKAENKIPGRDKIAFHYLLTLYSTVGKKEDVYRVWSTYKLSTPSILNSGYHAMIVSLLRLDDMERAEKIYEEWLLVRKNYDPKICNLLIRWYVRNGLLEKAERFLDQVFEVGGKVNADTWEYLAEGYIEKKQLSEALLCIKAAIAAERPDWWRLNASVVSTFISVCEQESDLESKDMLLEVLRQVGWFEDERYKLMVSTNGGTDLDNVDDDGTDMPLNLFQESL